jgi:hypothetical protein
MTLTQTISFLDEDEQAWVAPPPGSTMARPRASLLLQARGHATATSFIRGVDVRQGGAILINDREK